MKQIMVYRTSLVRMPLAITAAIAITLTAGSARADLPQGFVVGRSTGGSEIETYLGLNPTATSDFLAFSPSYTGGVYVGGGDVNGDGVPDTVVAADTGSGPTVEAFSGKDGSVLANFLAFNPAFTGGVRIAVGDVNGDGYRDIIAGAGAGGGPQLNVFSGKDHSTISSFFAFASGFQGGVSVAAGDVNHDGYADIIAGEGAGGSPTVNVFSGKDGSLLYSFLAFNPVFTGGVSVASGDVNGDGYSDIIVGAGPGGGPQVNVFSGLDGSLLYSFLAYNSLFTGGVQVAAADLNGDGQADIITGTGPGAGEVKAFSGTNEDLLLDLLPYGASYTGGVTVSGLSVPEPGSAALVCCGALGILFRRRRKR